MDDIYSFIEIKVKEVCRLEIENLKQEASASYSNETIASLREENNLLNIRLQELESCNESLREEARTLSDENKSLMTVIRLLNNQAATKEDGKFFQGMLTMAVLVICILISKVKVMVNVKRNQIQSRNNEKLLKLGRNLNFLNTPSNKQGQRLPEEL